MTGPENSPARAGPALLAKVAACVFVAASAAVNVGHAWHRAHSPVDAVVWCAVAIAASVTFALAIRAFSSAVTERRLAGGGLIALALLVSGGYSVVAALGAAHASRANPAIAEAATAGDRSRHESDIHRASDELALIPVVVGRPDDLRAKAARLRATPGANGCTRVDGPISRDVCPKADDADTDASRAERRAVLGKIIADATRALSTAKPTALANPDAVALVAYIGALGFDVQVERVNRWLVLLQVLLLECGGGLAMVVADNLHPSARRSADRQNADASEVAAASTAQGIVVLGEYAGGQSPMAQAPEPAQIMAFTAVHPSEHGASPCARERLLSFVQSEGGDVRGSQRAIAEMVGVSASRLNTIIGELNAEGKLQSRVGATGTHLRLVA